MNDPNQPAPLPPDSPLRDVLTAVAKQIRTQTGKPASFMAVPRVLALRLAGERAAQKKVQILDEHVASLLDANISPLLMALSVEEGEPAIPVLCMQLDGAIVAGWNWPVPRFAQHDGFEEHPDYAGVPFSRKLWDAQEFERIPELCSKLLNFCLEHIRDRPALAWQPVLEQVQSARPLVTSKAESEILPEDTALAWATIEAGLEERAEMIRRDLAGAGMFGLEFEGELQPELLDKLKAAFSTKFQALAEYGPHPHKSGWFSLVASPMSIITGGAE